MSRWAQLYNTPAWKGRRKAQLAMEPLCRMCQQMGRTTAARIADHIDPHRGDREKFFRGALQSLCKHCHDSHKQSQEKAGRARGCDADGNPFGGWQA